MQDHPCSQILNISHNHQVAIKKLSRVKLLDLNIPDQYDVFFPETFMRNYIKQLNLRQDIYGSIYRRHEDVNGKRKPTSPEAGNIRAMNFVIKKGKLYADIYILDTVWGRTILPYFKKNEVQIDFRMFGTSITLLEVCVRRDTRQIIESFVVKDYDLIEVVVVTTRIRKMMGFT